jgi:hypothetical protein
MQSGEEKVHWVPDWVIFWIRDHDDEEAGLVA